MTILTLDVVNGYMASNQAQKTADAAALAGAAALSASGTTWYSPVTLNSVCNGGTGDADTRAQAVAAQNLIAGLPPTSVTTSARPRRPTILKFRSRSHVPAYRHFLPACLAFARAAYRPQACGSLQSHVKQSTDRDTRDKTVFGLQRTSAILR